MLEARELRAERRLAAARCGHLLRLLLVLLRLLLVLLHLQLRLLLHLLHLLLQLRHQRRVAAAAAAAAAADGHGAGVRVGRLAAQIAELVLQIAAALLCPDEQKGLERLLAQSGNSSQGHSRLRACVRVTRARPGPSGKPAG